MTSLADIHNSSARTALREIVKPTLEAGGSAEAVLIVLESVVLGTLLTLYRDDPRKGAAMLDEWLLPRVIERLTALANNEARP